MYMNNGLRMRIILTQINLMSPNLQGYSCLRHWLGYYRSLARLHVWKCDACGIATVVTAYRDAFSQNTMNVNKGKS